MTKEQYYLMIEQLGEDPIEENIPPDGSDLDNLAQFSLYLFSYLPDRIEGMNGVWIGKDYSGLGSILDIYEFNNIEKRTILDYLHIIVHETSKIYDEQRKMKETIGGKR